MAADSDDTRSTPLGLYDRPVTRRVTGIEKAAIALSVGWLVLAAFVVMRLPATVGQTVGPGSEAAQGLAGLRFLLTALVVFLPVAMIWVAATAARASRVMREESARLQAAIDAIRHAYIAQAQGRQIGAEPSVARKLDEIAAAARKTETALATFATSRGRAAEMIRPKPAEPPPPDGQVSLPLGTSAEDIAPPLDRADFIRALNFPETVEDEEGFAALRKALADREARQLIQASQDVLTLLSQDGIYMDDLRPDNARPEVWRRFAQGERGRAVSALGGIRDRSSLALSAGRMKQDPIFRDATHHFLRRFDKVFADFAATASDSDISDLANTRTARAFMLLGRVSGMFG